MKYTLGSLTPTLTYRMHPDHFESTNGYPRWIPGYFGIRMAEIRQDHRLIARLGGPHADCLFIWDMLDDTNEYHPKLEILYENGLTMSYGDWGTMLKEMG